MQEFSFHTHTKGFDGKCSVEEMVQQAEKIGLKKIGFSNHFIVHPKIKDSAMFPYAVKGGYAPIYSADFDEAIEKFKPHYEEIDKIAQKAGLKLFKGMEVDFFNTNEWKDGFARAVEILKPDYVIGSAHFVEYKGNLCNMHDLQNVRPQEQNLMLYRYFQNLKGAAKSKLFTFLAHLDLPKKVGLGMGPEWEDEERAVVDVIKENNNVVELNTSFFKPERYEPYPSMRIMQMLGERNVAVIISDDAHHKDRLGEHFTETEIMAKSAGITSFYEPCKTQNASLEKGYERE